MSYAYAFIMSLFAALAAGIVVSAFSDELSVIAGTFSFVFASLFLFATSIDGVVDAIKKNKCTCHQQVESSAKS